MLQDLIHFLSKLERNNNKPWFDIYKDDFNLLREEWNKFVDDIISGIHEFDNQIQFISYKECTYRINRDIRFSKDKTPYKTWVGAYISPNGRNTDKPAYFFRVTSAGILRYGVGHWIQDPKILRRVRTNVLEHVAELKNIISEPRFLKQFGGLFDYQSVRVPAGFDKKTPNIDLIKYKSYACIREIDITKYDYTKLKQLILTVLKQGKPLIDYLRKMEELQPD